MRSSEVARLAGVTVRTLRHYHQLGVLDEPERSHNGYRTYTVDDLVRVLRIRRLAALGIPLERMPELLEHSADEDAETGALLEQLDAEFTEQIDRLVAQREVVRQMRGRRVPLDLAPELAPYYELFAEFGASPEMLRGELDATMLVSQLLGEAGSAGLVQLYAHLSAPELVPETVATMNAFAGLDDESTDAEIVALAERFRVLLGTVLERFDAEEWVPDSTASARMLTVHASDRMNSAQRRALELIDVASLARVDQPRAD